MYSFVYVPEIAMTFIARLITALGHSIECVEEFQHLRETCEAVRRPAICIMLTYRRTHLRYTYIGG